MYHGKKKIDLALEQSSKAVQTMNGVLEEMSDKQRKLFVALATGQDALHAVFSSGYLEFLTITHKWVLHTKDGHRFPGKHLCPDNLDRLDVIDYDSLTRVAMSHIKPFFEDYKLEQHLVDVRQLFKLVAPEAFGELYNVMKTSKKDGARVKAATEILDRAGVPKVTGDPKGQVVMPVQVNIRFDKSPQAEIVQTIDYMGGDSVEQPTG